MYFIKSYDKHMKNMCVLEKHVALAIKGKRIEIHGSQSYLDFHLDLFFIVVAVILKIRNA